MFAAESWGNERLARKELLALHTKLGHAAFPHLVEQLALAYPDRDASLLLSVARGLVCESCEKRGGAATGRCGGHTQVSRQAKHYAHKGINALSCDKAFQNPCHSAKRERKYVQQHIRICTHGVKTGLG